MTNTKDTTPLVIDWDLSLKLAGNKNDLAEEILNLLIGNLPDDLIGIKEAKKTDDFQELARRLHKLHGATCYCGVPRFKQSIALLETSLKQNDHSRLNELFEQFEREADQLLLAASERS